MPTVTLHIAENGKLDGISDQDRKAYAKFRSRIGSLGNGSITFTWAEPRSGPYHRRFFAILNRVFESQEQFHDQEHLLTWLKVGAGFADLVPGPNGHLVAVAKSIAWVNLDQAQFELVATAIWAFLRTPRATRFLWPHLADEAGMAMVDTILAEFGE